MSVLWSDEAEFTVTCNRGGRVYHRKGSNPLDRRYVEHSKTPRFFDGIGSFSGNGLGELVLLPKNFWLKWFTLKRIMLFSP